MEIKLNVTVELGQDAQKFVAGLLAGAIAGSAKEEKETPKANASAEPATASTPAERIKAKATAKKAVAKKAVAKKEEVIEEEVEEEADEAPAPKKVVAKKAVAKKVEEEEEAPAPKKAVAKKAVAKKTLDPSADEFEDLDADEQLEAIQKVVVRHTKKGKTADIRQLLGLFDVRKASELDEESYSQFYDLINRYAGGEEVEDIIEEFAE